MNNINIVHNGKGNFKKTKIEYAISKSRLRIAQYRSSWVY